MSWFNMIVANKARDLMKKNNPALYEDFTVEDDEGNSSSFEDLIEEENEEFIPGADIEKEELRKKVVELVDNLNDDKRTAIMLYYFNEMTTKEIAESLGVNENTVKSRLFQAKKELASGVKELEKKGFKFFGVAPISVVIWALKSSSTTAAAAYVASGAAAATFTAITASTVASAGTTAAVTTAGGIAAKIAGFTIAQKVVAGVATVAVVAGTATGTATVLKKHSEKIKTETTTTAAYVEEVTELSTENISENFSVESITTELETSEGISEIISVPETERTTKHSQTVTEKRNEESVSSAKPPESKTQFTTVKSSSVSQSTKPRLSTTKTSITEKKTNERPTAKPTPNRSTTTTTRVPNGTTTTTAKRNTENYGTTTTKQNTEKTTTTTTTKKATTTTTTTTTKPSTSSTTTTTQAQKARVNFTIKSPSGDIEESYYVSEGTVLDYDTIDEILHELGYNLSSSQVGVEGDLNATVVSGGAYTIIID